VVVFLRVASFVVGRRVPMDLFSCIVLSFAVAYPVVDEFTGGSLTDRYSEETTTGRTELIEEDITFWTENPGIWSRGR